METVFQHAVTNQVVQLFRDRGESQYGHEAVTQLEHALQAALLGEQEGAPASLITAALLHDVGHLLHDLDDDAPDKGIDDRHEVLAEQWMNEHFGPEVVAPAAMHVDAKRYLCATEKGYFERLSPPSVQSLALQGGPMSEAEVRAFESRPYWREAVRLRRWDDEAKVAGLRTPPIEHFAMYVDQAVR